MKCLNSTAVTHPFICWFNKAFNCHEVLLTPEYYVYYTEKMAMMKAFTESKVPDTFIQNISYSTKQSI
jgi:hypothetical protein